MEEIRLEIALHLHQWGFGVRRCLKDRVVQPHLICMERRDLWRLRLDSLHQDPSPTVSFLAPSAED